MIGHHHDKKSLADLNEFAHELNFSLLDERNNAGAYKEVELSIYHQRVQELLETTGPKIIVEFQKMHNRARVEFGLLNSDPSLNENAVDVKDNGTASETENIDDKQGAEGKGNTAGEVEEADSDIEDPFQEIKIGDEDSDRDDWIDEVPENLGKTDDNDEQGSESELKNLLLTSVFFWWRL